ncbi:T9SS type B sorting domain-containing protein, partial [Flavobacterium sp. BFFFF1]|uniref:T9SS type B sorting domain-containing protein n=1 Tax=Flavobacterium sp. BFFFF1 TaxID=2015557 RepID=UPI0025BD0F3C
VNPASILINYPALVDFDNLLSPNGEYILQVPVDKTMTLINPNDQLLVDTNYDGIFESGITQFSSFELRFRLNGGIPLNAGAGTFSIRSKDIGYLIFTQKNLIDSGNIKASFNLLLSCLPKDSDLDGIFDQDDFDSDNDGIPDAVEARGILAQSSPITDANQNGMDDAIEPGLGQLDSDADGVPDFYDLDSDNDGISDLIESGAGAADANNDGVIDGVPANFGANGYLNTLETALDNGILNFSIANTDGLDEIPNAISKDSDNDGCNDVIEAGFTDPDGDGKLGSAPVSVNPNNGLVTSGSDGNTAPVNNNYTTAAPIIINSQPEAQTGCEALQVVYTIDTTPVDGYQWQVSTDEVSYTNLVNNTQYTGVNSISLTVGMLNPTMSGYRYRVVLSKTGNTCGLASEAATLTVLPRPTVPATINLVQCDDDADGLSDFNLRQKESQISTNAANETFSYFKTQAAAETNDSTQQITNELAYNNTDGNTVWVRVQNNDGCYNVTRMNLIVSFTQIPPGTLWTFSECDDFVDTVNDDRDGITTFNFSSVNTNINALLGNSAAYTIKYFRNEVDALAETDASGNSLAIADISNYRNIGLPNEQFVWVRVESNADNACYGLGPYVKLTVEALPVPNPVAVQRQCDRDPSDAAVDFDFDTSNIQSMILNGQSAVSVAYFDQNNNPLPSPLPNPFRTATQNIKVVLTNDNGKQCTDEMTIRFVVDAKPVANPVTVAPVCDDEPDDTDGLYSFDTSTIQADLLQGQSGFNVKYIDGNGTPLASPLPNPFLSPTQNITAVVENPINTTCAASTVITFTVNQLPEILDDNAEIICSGIINESVTLYAGLANGNPNSFTYEWSRNGVVIPNETRNELTVNLDGVYTTLVTNKLTGCSRTRTNTVTYSQIATITSVDINDLVPENSININVTGAGIYEYSLDNPVGPFQDSPFFENVSAGFHEIFVNDKNGCGQVKQTISVVGAPLFFTPNGDGYNDYWKIKGVNAVYHKNTVVYIFDRYGKLLKEIPSGVEIGWDGLLNGNPLPADDYWFVINLDDGRTAKGHFTLKR